jgi:hypothetical protein
MYLQQQYADDNHLLVAFSHPAYLVDVWNLNSCIIVHHYLILKMRK